MTEPARRYWFHAKTAGWGWGLPATWQGWVFFIAWFVITLTIGPWIAMQNLLYFYGFMAVMVVVLVGVCWLKGEPPRWRWG